jgi:hypothetical protein
VTDRDPLQAWDALCREVYDHTRMPPGTREVVLAMGWVLFRHPDRPNGKPFWREVRRRLGANELGRARMHDLIAADAPRYEQRRNFASMGGSCEGPRLRPYRPRVDRTPYTTTRVHAAAGAPTEPYDHTEGGRICGDDGRIEVIEADMTTGWHTSHWFCRRHADRARQVKAQLAARGEPPPPIPNVGGLLPCYFKADWETVYAGAVKKSIGTPYGWERPYYGLSADDWPVPGKQPIPRRPRLAVIHGQAS